MSGSAGVGSSAEAVFGAAAATSTLQEQYIQRRRYRTVGGSYVAGTFDSMGAPALASAPVWIPDGVTFAVLGVA